MSFLDACSADGVHVLGWELWIIDHKADENWLPSLSPGDWCGLIPTRQHPTPAVIAGEGDLEKTRKDIEVLDVRELIEPRWLRFIRVNFTLE